MDEPCAGRARTAAAGFRLCGIDDEPPPAASETSPTSVCASRTTSRPTFAHAAAAASSAAPSSATGPRWTCHGTTGSGQARARRRTATSAPDRASRPARRAAPAARPPRVAAASSTSATSQPAAFSPKVVGAACWSSVRAAIGVERCVLRERGGRRGGAVELGQDELPWRCGRRASTPCRGCPGSSRGPVGVRRPLAQRPRERHDGAPSARPSSQSARCRRARGGTPPRPPRRPGPPRARARPRASRRARLRPRPPRGADPARRSARRSSMREEDGRTVALHADIEPHCAVLLLGDERRAPPPRRGRTAPGRPRSPRPRPGSRCVSARASASRARRRGRRGGAPRPAAARVW